MSRRFSGRTESFGNIDAQRVGTVGFLNQRLRVTGQQPVDEHFGAVGMGRAIEQANRAAGKT